MVLKFTRAGTQRQFKGPNDSVALTGAKLSKKPDDIQSENWIPVEWRESRMLDGLDVLRSRAEQQSGSAISWYWAKKKTKNVWSRVLRFWAIMFSVLGGLVPILSTTGLFDRFYSTGADTRMAELKFNQFGYVFIGLAAGCVAFDRFFGFSTNWMRYIAAATRIETARLRFRFEWKALIAPLKGRDPNDDQLVLLLDAIAHFSLSIREAIEHETGSWIAEFQTNLSLLDKETKALFETAHHERKLLEQRNRGEFQKLISRKPSPL